MLKKIYYKAKYPIIILLVGILIIFSVYALSAGGNYPITVNTDITNGGIINWTNKDYIKLNDTSYATASITAGEDSMMLKAQNFNFSIPDNANITGIELRVSALCTGVRCTGRGVQKEVYLITESEEYNYVNRTNTTKVTTTEMVFISGNSTDTWGRGWTASQINSQNFGIGISYWTGASDLSATININYVTIKIYYNITAPPPYNCNYTGGSGLWYIPCGCNYTGINLNLSAYNNPIWINGSGKTTITGNITGFNSILITGVSNVSICDITVYGRLEGK